MTRNICHDGQLRGPGLSVCQSYGYQPPVTRLREVFGEVSNTGKDDLENKVVDLNVVEESARVTN